MPSPASRNRFFAALLTTLLFLGVLSCSRGDKEAGKAGEDVVSKRVKIDIKELERAGEGAPERPLSQFGAEKAGPIKLFPTEEAPKTPAAAPSAPPQPPAAPEVKLTEQALREEPRKTAPAETARVARIEEGKPRASNKKADKTPRPPSTIKEAIRRPWAVNVASFSNRRDAEGLKDVLKASGYYSYTADFVKNGKKWYRVRVGFYGTRDEAARESRTIARSFGIPTAPWVVKPPIEEVLRRR